MLASAEHKAITLDYIVAEEAWQRRKVRGGLVMALFIPALASLVLMLAMWLVAGEEYSFDQGGNLQCRQRVCSEWLEQRLSRGQTLTVKLSGTASGPPKLHLDGKPITPFPRSWVSVADAKIDDAPWDGWFRVVVEVPGPANARFEVE
jgi:hypothetical protein